MLKLLVLVIRLSKII